MSVHVPSSCAHRMLNCQHGVPVCIFHNNYIVKCGADYTTLSKIEHCKKSVFLCKTIIPFLKNIPSITIFKFCSLKRKYFFVKKDADLVFTYNNTVTVRLLQKSHFYFKQWTDFGLNYRKDVINLSKNSWVKFRAPTPFLTITPLLSRYSQLLIGLYLVPVKLGPT